MIKNNAQSLSRNLFFFSCSFEVQKRFYLDSLKYRLNSKKLELDLKMLLKFVSQYNQQEDTTDYFQNIIFLMGNLAQFCLGHDLPCDNVQITFHNQSNPFTEESLNVCKMRERIFMLQDYFKKQRASSVRRSGDKRTVNDISVSELMKQISIQEFIKALRIKFEYEVNKQATNKYESLKIDTFNLNVNVGNVKGEEVLKTVQESEDQKPQTPIKIKQQSEEE